MRLRLLAMTADVGMLEEARTHVERVWHAAELTRPLAPEQRDELATAMREAAEARAAEERAKAEAEEERRRRLGAEASAAERLAALGRRDGAPTPHNLFGQPAGRANGSGHTNGAHVVALPANGAGTRRGPAVASAARSVTSAIPAPAEAAVELPTTEAGVRQWVNNWTRVCHPHPQLALRPKAPADWEKLGMSQRQFRKVKAAALAPSRPLRKLAEDYGVPVPDGYIDDLAELTRRAEVAEQAASQ
jgi:hypothetical protein